MNKVPYIIGNDSVTLIINWVPKTIRRGSTNFAVVKRSVLAGDFDKAVSMMDIKTAVTSYAKTVGSLITVINDKVYFNNKVIHNAVCTKIRSLLRDGVKDVTPFTNFLGNLLKNPCEDSVTELYDFLAYSELPIDEDGFVIAYKGVEANFWSRTGNLETVVIKGKVDSQGRIFNGVGEYIEVERKSVDPLRRNTCSFGLHVGSYNYAKGFSAGKVMLVRFNPKDAISVPTDESCQKLRVCAYEVLADVTDFVKPLEKATYCSKDKNFRDKAKTNKTLAELRNDVKDIISKFNLDMNIPSDRDFVRDAIDENYLDTDLKTVLNELTVKVSKFTKQEQEILKRVAKYVSKDGATIKQIHGMLRIKGFTSKNLIDLLQKAGYDWKGQDGTVDGYKYVSWNFTPAA